MSGADQIFADGIRSIAVTGSVVRIDFVALSVDGTGDPRSPKTDLVQRVIMPLDGFLAAVGKLQETVQMLVKRGVVRTQQSAGPAEAASEASSALPGFSGTSETAPSANAFSSSAQSVEGEPSKAIRRPFP